jgi:5-methylcytosine-specific restriction endonuclease McrA
MSHTLVLNASFEPIRIISWQKALQLLFQGKVEVIEESDFQVRSVSVTICVPAVLRLIKYVPLLSNKRKVVRFTRLNVFLRDLYTCQYCRKKFSKTQLTLDHVIPVTQGGRRHWENIVSSCRPCNQKKGGRTPEQAGIRLLKKPNCPGWLPSAEFHFGVAFIPERWKIYFNVTIDENQYDSEEDDPPQVSQKKTRRAG